MKTKKGDFVEIDYIAKANDQVFDLTKEEKAKELNIHQENAKYKPLIICLGESQVIKGLDEALENQETNKQLTIEIEPEKAFGNRDRALVRLIPLKKFKDEKIAPYPGLQVNIDNNIGTVRSVSSGRVMIDFNHPLADKKITYEVTINRILTDTKEKLENYINFYNIPAEIKVDNNKAEIKNIPEPIQKILNDKLKTLFPKLEIQFINSKTTNKT